MKAIIAISDTHVGGFEGLCPGDGIQLDSGNRFMPSKFQSYVWECWEHFWHHWVPAQTKHAKRIVVVHNGDVVDGNHHEAVNLLGNVATQEKAAVRILKPIADKYPLYMVRGTEAHGGKSEQSTERVAETLKCQEDKDTGNRTWWQVWLDIDGRVFQFAHHIGTTSSAAYETSAPMRELVAGLVESAQWKQRLPDVFVRSHRHRFLPISIPSVNGRIQLVVTPAWQLRTPMIERVDRMRLPHIGGVIFRVEDGRCETIEKIYPMPVPEPIRW